MTDLFVSYKAEDRPRVAPLVHALHADGYSVWWDAEIGGGEEWRETICRHLDAARQIIVVWSDRSVGPHGNFVRDEATRALRRRAYLPVRIDAVEPPLGFGEMQSLDLVGWKGSRRDRRYRALLSALRSRMAGEEPAMPPQPVPKGIDRRTAVAGGAVAIAAAAAGGWTLLRPTAAKADSIAVLPFANLSGDPAQDYFSDGIAEELRSALARIAGLKVVGRISSEAVRDEDAKAAARHLSVANVLTGSVRRSPRVIRVNAQLLDGRNGIERWSETYDREPGDVIDVQTDIAKSVAEALSFNLGQDATGPGAGGTRNPAAQDLYLKAMALRRGGIEEDLLREAIALFDAAITLDPRFAEAFAQKSIALTDFTGFFSESPQAFEQGYAKAISTARRATGLAPGSSIGHAALAEALSGLLQFRDADAEYRKAAAAGSSDPIVISGHALFLTLTGRSAEGLPMAERGIALDPLSPRAYATLGNVQFQARQYAATIRSFERVINLAKVRANYAFVRIGECHLMLGDTAKAREWLSRAPPDHLFRLTIEAILAMRTGDRAASEAKLARLRQVSNDTALYQEAEVLAQQKERDQAFAALDRAVRLRDPGLVMLTVDSYLEPLQGDSRFKALAAKLGFPL